MTIICILSLVLIDTCLLVLILRQRWQHRPRRPPSIRTVAPVNHPVATDIDDLPEGQMVIAGTVVDKLTMEALP